MSFIVNKADRSKDLLVKLIEKDSLRKSKVVVVFVTYDDEVDTLPIVEHCWQNGITVTVPEFLDSIGQDFLLRQWSKSDRLVESSNGIFHPRNNKTLSLSKADLIFVPGLAFTKSGERLGRGKGFYDRFLAKSIDRTIGLCFSEQIKDSLPVGDLDMKVQEVITC